MDFERFRMRLSYDMIARYHECIFLERGCGDVLNWRSIPYDFPGPGDGELLELGN